MASYQELSGALEALARSVRSRTISPQSSLLAQCESLVAAARKGDIAESKWTPFVEAFFDKELNPKAVQKIAEVMNVSEQEVSARLRAEMQGQTLMVNSRYQVMVRMMGDDVAYLSVKRLDQRPIRRWRDLQRIKNELVGPECEGMEMFPAESRLLDSANQYHLFVFRDPTVRLPFGQQDTRIVMDGKGDTGEGQEPFDE